MAAAMGEDARPAGSGLRAPRASEEQLGVWGPGVRLLRRMHFTAKAVLVALALVLPLLALMGWMAMSQVDQAMQARRDATRQAIAIARRLFEQTTLGQLP